MKKKRFGEYLRSLRLEKRIGLRQFAKAVGILPSNLCHIESGRHSSHQGKEFIEKIAKALRLEEGSKEYEKLFDLAAHPGEIPKVISGDQLWTIVVPTGQRLLVYSRDRKVFRLHPKTICAAFAQLDFEIAAGNELINPKRKE